MSHFADGAWHPLVGTYTSNSVTGITFTTSATVNRGTFTTPTKEAGYTIDSSLKGKRPYRVFGVLTPTTVGTKGSGADQNITVRVSHNSLSGDINGQLYNVVETSPTATLSSSTSTVNTIRFDLFVWLAPGETATIQTKTACNTLGNGVAAVYRLDYTVEAI